MIGYARLFQYYCLALNVAGLGLVVMISLGQTDGLLIYSLDDPYIHLAVAESILEGGYGINAGEYASPASSIIYPFLLAGLLSVGLGTTGPLLLSALFAFLATWVAAGFTSRLLQFDRTVTSVLSFALMGPALVFLLNALALPMNGMEHTMHVFGTVLALSGLYRVLVEEDRMQLWAVVVGAVICALVRFEGLGLVLAAVAALVLARHWFSALAIVGIVGGILLVYAQTMLSLGLPALPSSVMTKSDLAANATEMNLAGLARELFGKLFWYALGNRWGITFAICATFFLFTAFDTGRDFRHRLFFLAVASVLAAHVIAGRYGWFGRYEVYVAAAMVMGVTAFLHLANAQRLVVARLWLPFAMLILAVPYGIVTKETPAASANIYQQHYQMHRFVQDHFPEAVAVNDLGWVAFQNDNYVLDLWGLGSEEARLLTREGGWSAEALDEITQVRGVAFAMIYDEWFRNIPANWCSAASLTTSAVTSDHDTVAFYLIETGRANEFMAALREFEGTLPQGATLDIHGCP